MVYSGIVIDQSVKMGFHWRTIDELAQTRIATQAALPITGVVTIGNDRSTPSDEKASVEVRENEKVA